jgi:DNA-directed RNA polymerase specialized sigma24 family protein
VTVEFTEYEYRTAKRAAGSVTRINNGYLEADDVLGSIYEWMSKNYDKVVEWREEGSKGYFNTAVYRAGLRYALAERKARTGAHDEDLHFYSPGQIEELLPLLWDRELWSMDAPTPGRGGSSKPAEGNTKIAMLVDVSSALVALNDEEREILRRRFADGEPLDHIALSYETTEDALRMRIVRIIRKMVKRLGGEPPWWGGPGSRRVRSNASSQVEVAT